MPVVNNPKERFQLFECIGSGSFGKVYRAIDRNTNANVAIKVVNLEHDSQGLEEIQKEVQTLSHCESPNIIKYHGSYLVDSSLWIVMDFCGLGSFREILDTCGSLDEISVLFITREVLGALSYLHSNNIMHRDIKAANILLTDQMEVNLGDLGVASQILNTIKRNGLAGSPYWMAPEVIKQSHHDSKADIWSLGISVIELLKGSPPLSNLIPSKALYVIPKSAPPRLDSNFSIVMRELVAYCLHDDPQKRPSADQLLKLKAFKGLKKSIPATLFLAVERYRNSRRSDTSMPPLIPGTTSIHNTVKSGWTFGTLNNSIHEPSPIDSNNSDELQEDFEYLKLEEDENKIDLICKVSPINVDNEDQSTLKLTKVHSQSSFLTHRRDSSPMSLFDKENDDPLSLLTARQLEQAQKRDKLLKIYSWPYEIIGKAEEDRKKVYKIMTDLKQALAEIPRSSDPRSSVAEIEKRVEEQRAFAIKFLTRIKESYHFLKTSIDSNQSIMDN